MRSRTGFLTEEWYESPRVKLDDKTMMYMRARTPAARHAFASGPLGEHARWMLEQIRKYEPMFGPWWKPWVVEPRNVVLCIEPIPPPPPVVVQAASWLLTAVVTFKAVFR